MIKYILYITLQADQSIVSTVNNENRKCCDYNIMHVGVIHLDNIMTYYVIWLNISLQVPILQIGIHTNQQAMMLQFEYTFVMVSCRLRSIGCMQLILFNSMNSDSIMQNYLYCTRKDTFHKKFLHHSVTGRLKLTFKFL